MTKYKRWHNQIISRAKSRKIAFEFERHHIKPKCIGGDNSKKNIVKLTYREHFLIHWLLTKIYNGKKRRLLLYSLNMMTCRFDKQIVAGWQYDIARRAASEASTGIKLTEERKSYQSEILIGNKNALGMKHSEETKRSISKTLKDRYKKTPMIGKRHTKKTIAKIKKCVNDLYNFGNLREQRKIQAAIRTRDVNGRWS